MLKIKDNVDLKELTKIPIKLNLIATTYLINRDSCLLLRERDFRDSTNIEYFNYLKIDKSTRIISDVMKVHRENKYGLTID